MGKLETRRRMVAAAGRSRPRRMSPGEDVFSLDFLSSMTIMAYVVAGRPVPNAAVGVGPGFDVVSF